MFCARGVGGVVWRGGGSLAEPGCTSLVVSPAEHLRFLGERGKWDWVARVIRPCVS